MKRIIRKIKEARLFKRAKANRLGSAIMLVMFILSGVMIVILAGSSVVISGLKMGRIQSDSIHAYYAAESGMERLLFVFRQEDFLSTLGETPADNVLSHTETNSPYFTPWSYSVNYDEYSPLRFTSIGSYAKTRRSVEVTFY